MDENEIDRAVLERLMPRVKQLIGDPREDPAAIQMLTRMLEIATQVMSRPDCPEDVDDARVLHAGFQYLTEAFGRRLLDNGHTTLTVSVFKPVDAVAAMSSHDDSEQVN